MIAYWTSPRRRGRVLVGGVLRRLPSGRPARVAEQREDRDEDHPGGQLAAAERHVAHAQPSNAVASGAGANRIPAAAAPSLVLGLVADVECRVPGSTPSRSSASRNDGRIRLRRAGLGAGHDRREEVTRRRSAPGAPRARRPSSRRRRGRFHAREASSSVSSAPGIASKRIDAMKSSTNDSGSRSAPAASQEDAACSRSGARPATRRRGRRTASRPVVGDLGRERGAHELRLAVEPALSRATGRGSAPGRGAVTQRPVAVDGDGVEVSETHPGAGGGRPGRARRRCGGRGRAGSVVEDDEAPLADRPELPRLRALAQVGERRLVSAVTDVDVGIELASSAGSTGPASAASPATFLACASRMHVADQRLVGDGRHQAGVDEDVDDRRVRERRVDRAALPLDRAHELRAPARACPVSSPSWVIARSTCLIESPGAEYRRRRA